MNQKKPKELEQLRKLAWKMRIDSLKMIYNASSGHIGGSFSAAELLTALYFYRARLKPENPDWEMRDRIYVSKGHCAPILYAILAERGYFDREELGSFRKLGSRLQGHPVRGKLPGIEMSSGPLGLGASVSVGTALGFKLQRIDSLVFCLLGDGEIQEGIVWEAAMSAFKYRLDNLVFILDYNGFQLSGSISDTMPLEPVCEKWKSFGWQVTQIDGNDMKAVVEAFDSIERPDYSSPAKEREDCQPTIIIARTRKGYGVSFMENDSRWHGKVPSKEEYERALDELNDRIKGEDDGQTTQNNIR